MRYLLWVACLALFLGCSKGRPEPNSLEPILTEANSLGLVTSLDEIDSNYTSKSDDICESLNLFDVQLDQIRPHFFQATRILEKKDGEKAIEAFREINNALIAARSIPIKGNFAPERDLTDLTERFPKELDQIKDAIRLLLASAVIKRLKNQTDWQDDFDKAVAITVICEQGPTMRDKLNYISCANYVLDCAEILAVPNTSVSILPLPNLNDAFGYEIARFRKFIRQTDANNQEKLDDNQEARIDLYRRLNHEEADQALIQYLAKIVELIKVEKTNPQKAIEIGNEAIVKGRQNPKDLPARVVGMQIPICINLIKKKIAMRERLKQIGESKKQWNPAAIKMKADDTVNSSRQIREMEPMNQRPPLPDLR